MSPAQCRAARAVLGWTQSDLAQRAGLAKKTIADFELDLRSLQFRTRRDIRNAFEEAGIEFTWSETAEGQGAAVAEGREAAVAAKTEGLRYAPRAV